VHRGCVVVAVDMLDARLKVAGELGADHLIDASTQDVKEEVAKLVPEGADTVFECTGSPACIEPSIELCRKYGTFVWQGYYGTAPISMHFVPPHGRRLTMFFPSDDGLEPCRHAVIKNMARGALHWDKCITHHVDYEGAADIFTRIGRKEKDIVGVTIDWKQE